MGRFRHIVFIWSIQHCLRISFLNSILPCLLSSLLSGWLPCFKLRLLSGIWSFHLLPRRISSKKAYCTSISCQFGLLLLIAFQFINLIKYSCTILLILCFILLNITNRLLSHNFFTLIFIKFCISFTLNIFLKQLILPTIQLFNLSIQIIHIIYASHFISSRLSCWWWLSYLV